MKIHSVIAIIKSKQQEHGRAHHALEKNEENNNVWLTLVCRLIQSICSCSLQFYAQFCSFDPFYKEDEDRQEDRNDQSAENHSNHYANV